jgi:glycosyltransferase involved in cell wall biosynthesis
MSGNKRVCVLMSTYNGERYLIQQIESILSQQDVDIKLIVRDDGSSDGTINILMKYNKDGKLIWYGGNNIGPAHSFLDLLEKAPSCDYYAFSDQDDYWQPDKLCSAVKKLQHCTTPGLYFSQTQLANCDLKPMESVEINPFCTFAESLIYQFVGGCTMVMNDSLRGIVCRYKPNFIPMHDVWIYDVALAVGSVVIFDRQSHILYRQHNNNVVGQGYGIIEDWRRRMHRILNRGQLRSRLAKEIFVGYHDIMDENNLKILYEFLNSKANLPERLKLITNKVFVCSDKKTNILFRLAVLFNNY